VLRPKHERFANHSLLARRSFADAPADGLSKARSKKWQVYLEWANLMFGMGIWIV
jgi:hypothetical protein